MRSTVSYHHNSRMEDVVNRTAPVGSLSSVCDAEVLPLVCLHLWARLAITQLEELGDEWRHVSWYTSGCVSAC
jgi:hypothetical protein